MVAAVSSSAGRFADAGARRARSSVAFEDVDERLRHQPADLLARIDAPALDAALDAATDEAAARGVFGAPTMYVGDEMFFGNDRFDFVRASLGAAA